MDKSTEYQHHALQMMAQHAASPHPICYAVWYEYAAGINPALNGAIDALKAQNGVIDDATICALYRQHVAGRLDGDGANGALAGNLDESRREIEKLRGEILRAREDALTDELTGLLNRRGFDVAFRDGLAAYDQNAGPAPSLLIADLDHFKKINDSYGHIFGDRVIRAVAKILRDNVKGKDVAARYGGEEFVVLLPDTPLQGAHSLAEKIRATVAHSQFCRIGDKGGCERVTVSIGVARYRVGESSVDFAKRADRALYAAKASGRNRVMVAEAMAPD